MDLQLYAFIAIIIREFVYAWYAKITPDQTFVEEAVKIIAHCTRGLEQRLRKVDLEALIFDELPELLDTHVRGEIQTDIYAGYLLQSGITADHLTIVYRIAYNPIHHNPLEPEPRLIYHSLWPTPALSPVPGKNDPASVLIQKENEAAYRQLLVEGVLAILLPTEDFENDCLTSLVGQIISEMILGNGIGEKACEPWLLWEGITKMAEVIQAKLPASKAQERINKSIENTSRADPSSAGTVKNISTPMVSSKGFLDDHPIRIFCVYHGKVYNCYDWNVIFTAFSTPSQQKDAWNWTSSRRFATAIFKYYEIPQEIKADLSKIRC